MDTNRTSKSQAALLPPQPPPTTPLTNYPTYQATNPASPTIPTDGTEARQPKSPRRATHLREFVLEDPSQVRSARTNDSGSNAS